MVDLAEGLDKWMKDVAETISLTTSQKSAITGAGAAVYAKVLKENTPRSTESYKSGRKVGRANGRKTKHLNESITFRPGYTSDKLHTGDTAVGFDSPYQDLVASFVNNGTREMSAKEVKNMHFKDRAEIEAKDAVLKANAAMYKKVTGL
ncbi:HK97 gp10 family phage protein [Lactobacillus sp. LL6]|uniref:HK97 gp10 family phage protein n=1 Tax=Lactobacillus sp. LL6 TaxID=2596827 RepID=UPI0011863C88|nr:HK97 gp10 family phage protein [Lactobacillus sp. LL6]TSO25293.1 hypothetical protein FOD82_08625 [Lactobacillus sp. LL6]